jgi:inhibitor of KinA sporulation pathway (predicted exonuclease)
MAKKLDQILVIDVEATCWQGAPPAGQSSEIIEIGLCTIDVAKLERVEKRSLLVKPATSEISDFCTQLTTLTANDVADAGSLKDAIRILEQHYHPKTRLWASWGDYDRFQFENECRAKGIDYPFGKSHLNVKSLFAAATGLKREVGMAKAYKALGWQIAGTHHRGVDDAWNIAGILCRLLNACRQVGG